jgi:prepilin-type N-terminal cleavage/methylation domain-containing protein
MRRKLSNGMRDQRGLTMIEMLVAMAMALIVLAGAGTVIVVAAKNTPRVAERSADVQAGMVLQERVGREVRQGYRILNGTPSSLELYTYRRVATCGSTTPLAATAPAIACRVTYSCSVAGSCTRSETDPTGTLTPSVQTVVTGLTTNEVFTYSPDAAAPDYITMTLSFKGQRGDDSVTLQDGFELRNR